MANYDDLWTSVLARYSTAVIKNLTNPQDGATTTTTTAKGTAAAQDVVGDFAAKGITYDNAEPSHLAVGELGVIAKLQMRTIGYEWAWKRHQEYIDRLEALRMATANNRMLPTTNSVLEPAAEESGSLPDMDPSRFGDILPGAP